MSMLYLFLTTNVVNAITAHPAFPDSCAVNISTYVLINEWGYHSMTRQIYLHYFNLLAILAITQLSWKLIYIELTKEDNARIYMAFFFFF